MHYILQNEVYNYDKWYSFGEKLKFCIIGLLNMQICIFIILVLCSLQSATQFLKHHYSADHKI